MTEARKGPGKGALYVILAFEALISFAAIGVGLATGNWLPVIVVLAMGGVIAMLAVMRLTKTGS
ncbi:MAG: hypothetical protein AAGF20_09975 [Pseudomonadota bacterium]